MASEACIMFAMSRFMKEKDAAFLPDKVDEKHTCFQLKGQQELRKVKEGVPTGSIGGMQEIPLLYLLLF